MRGYENPSEAILERQYATERSIGRNYQPQRPRDSRGLTSGM